MALPKALLPSLTPLELEFLSEEVLVEIVPSYSMKPIRLLSGVYGPFIPPRKIKVPLWFAANLKGRRGCNIVPPDWLTPESLQEVLATETSLGESFGPLPERRFFELSKILLDCAYDNVINPSLIRSLIKDIRQARESKLRLGIIPKMNENPSDEGGINGEYLQLTNLTPLEINELRPFFVRAVGAMAKLAPPSNEVGRGRDEIDDDEEGYDYD